MQEKTKEKTEENEMRFHQGNREQHREEKYNIEI